MKKLLKTLLFILFLAGTTFALPFKQDFIIIDDGIVYVTANDYSNANHITVELLDGSQSVQASTNTQLGSTVNFTLQHNSKFVRTTYHFDRGDAIIILDVIID